MLPLILGLLLVLLLLQIPFQTRCLVILIRPHKFTFLHLWFLPPTLLIIAILTLPILTHTILTLTILTLTLITLLTLITIRLTQQILEILLSLLLLRQLVFPNFFLLQALCVPLRVPIDRDKSEPKRHKKTNYECLVHDSFTFVQFAFI